MYLVPLTSWGMQGGGGGVRVNTSFVGYLEAMQFETTETKEGEYIMQ